MTLEGACRRDADGRKACARAVLSALLARYRGGCGADDLALAEGLFVGDGDAAAGWLTGISEISIAFRAGQAPAIRALAETLKRRPLDAALARTGLEWGTETLDRVAACASEPYAVPLFRELYECIYLGDIAAPPPAWRFGVAVELGARAPVVKTYFDLYARPAGRRRDTFQAVAAMLGRHPGLDAWNRVWSGVDLDASRIVGVDFGAGDVVRTKFYWGARRLSWDGIRVAARQISGARHTETLDRLAREVADLPGSLGAVQVSMCDAQGVCAMKVDVCLARLFEDDGLAYEAIERVRRPVTASEETAPFDIISGGLEPRRTRCVQQYLGIELSPDRDPRVTIYYRPIGFETEHLNPFLRPRACA